MPDPTIVTAEFLESLQTDKTNFADNLNTMGVEASHSETFTELVPKILDISTGGVCDGSVSNPFVDQFIFSLKDGFNSSTPPLNPSDGDLWINDSVTPSIIKKYDAENETWITIGA